MERDLMDAYDLWLFGITKEQDEAPLYDPSIEDLIVTMENQHG